ncbi:MAG TPA: aminoglycoside adenylyltransferase domain-containing protein [Beutenbergiaceae bacterium]|nr:aminoglycoside adenylyltransferase domain-containing protein [Beutenbergiaceae bacterium]
MSGGQRWPDCDSDIVAFTTGTVEVLRRGLGADLVGVYLHGSLAMGSYYRPKSDIDILVLSRPLTPAQRRQISRDLARHADSRPTSGDLELSVITARTAARARAPMSYQVHYSTTWNRRILADEVDWHQTPDDPDLPAHVMVTRHRGVVLSGPPIPEVIGQVPWPEFADAVLGDLTWILSGETLYQDPVYGVLNICRAWHVLGTGEQVVLSKEEGALWALEYLPERHHRLIRAALASYRSPQETPAATTANRAREAAALRSLADDASTLLPAADPG